MSEEQRELEKAIRLLNDALTQWMLGRPSPDDLRPHREALWKLQEEVSKPYGRLIGV